MTAELSFSPVDYKHEHLPHLLDFLRECLPQSGRALDIDGRHSFYKDIEGCFEGFWCMFDDSRIIGAVGLKRLDAEKCEL